MNEEELKLEMLSEMRRWNVKYRRALYREAVCKPWKLPLWIRRRERAEKELVNLRTKYHEIFETVDVHPKPESEAR